MKDIASLLYNSLMGQFQRRKLLNYDAKRFFESRYSAMSAPTDRDTLSPTTSKVYSLHHYKCIEVNILEAFIKHVADLDSFSALDIGPGAGHWIRFFSDIMGFQRVVGLEIAGPAVQALKQTICDHNNKIEIIEGDISDVKLPLNEKFDIISAIGMIHHIVDDDLWLKALSNIANCLRPGGLAFITDRLGFLTLNDSFVDSDDFTSWEKKHVMHGRPIGKFNYLIKRSRSRRMWQSALARNRCEILEIKPFRPGVFFYGLRSRFNLLIFRNKGY